jgi:hypothetical protein
MLGDLPNLGIYQRKVEGKRLFQATPIPHRFS